MSRSVAKDKLKNKPLPEALAEEKACCQSMLLVPGTNARNRKWFEKKIRDIDSILKDIVEKEEVNV